MSLRSNVKYAALATLTLALLSVLCLTGAYVYVSRTLPRVETLSDYRPPVITQVYSNDGTQVARYFREQRTVVPVEEIPPLLMYAFIAAEDSNFFEHRGIDFVSIFRAALKNIMAGGIVQGGSTITQQVAKSLLLTPERKFSRKFKEAILAWRMENALSKNEILYLYLNQIYLGHGAYGVQAAAENYFDKDVRELNLAQSAMLAGLPQAPSRYSPYRHYERARDRQRYVLERMVIEGFITQQQADSARQQELTIHPRARNQIPEAAYFVEQVRRYLVGKYGEERLYKEGLQVHTSVDLDMQKAAYDAVRRNLHSLDKRQGFRGAIRVLESPGQIETFLAEQEKTFKRTPLKTGDLVKALVVGEEQDELLLRLGPFEGRIDPATARWAGSLRLVDVQDNSTQEPSPNALPAGSVVLVRIEEITPGAPLRLLLDQTPKAQGALVALDPHTGEIRSMVGGYDFFQSQFNRVLQSSRLPGSAIKPLIYAAALDKGYTAASVLLDTPLIFEETDAQGREFTWKPRNYGEKFYGPTSLRDALAHSRNVVTVRILEDIGIGYAISYARKLGIDSPMNRDLTLALGSSAVTPMELATSYAVFANGGIRIAPTTITRILDREGRILESVDPADFPEGPAEDQTLLTQAAARVISPETAYLITNILESAVQKGTGWRAKALGRPVAGKTGTTNDLKDAWFVGYTPSLVTVSWTGFDQERPLGDKETGSRAAAPAWVSFMKEALKKSPAVEFPVPDSIEFHPIVPQTGLLSDEDTRDYLIEAFAPGTAPSQFSPDQFKSQARDFFKLDLQDL